MKGASFEQMWKRYIQLRKESIEIMAAMCAYIADNRNAKLSLRAQQALAAFSPTSIKGRVLDLLTEYGVDMSLDEMLASLNAQPGQPPTTIGHVRSCMTELADGGYAVRVKPGVYRAVEDDDAEGVQF
jgi:hypothetical protein